MLKRLHSASDELLHLDFLRLIASCGIVLLHLARFLSRGTQAIIGPVGGMTIFVDLFFAISGFVIAYVYTGRLNGWAAYGTFLRRRVARLAPLHWATFGLFLAVGVMIWTGKMSSDHVEFYDPRDILPNVLAVHAWGFSDHLSFNDVSWSISAEMGMYLIAPVLLAIAARSAVALAVAAIGAILLLGFAPQQPWLDWTAHFGVARALPSFMLGVALARWRGLIARLPGARLMAVAAFAMLMIGVRANWPPIALLPVVYALVVAAIAADLGGRYAPLRIGALGQLTYSLYMIHPIVRTFFISFVGGRILKVQGIGADLMVAAGFALTFVLAYASFVYFETPARRLLSTPRRKRPAGEAQPG